MTIDTVVSEPQQLVMPSYNETTKLTDKTEVILPTPDHRVENHLKFRRCIAQMTLRSPLLGQIREYGRTSFDLSEFEGTELKPLHNREPHHHALDQHVKSRRTGEKFLRARRGVRCSTR